MDSLGESLEMRKMETEESKGPVLGRNALYVLIAAVFTWIARGMAIDAANRSSYEANGRRSGLKNLIASIVEGIGTTGVTIIGILIIAFIIYSAYQRFQNPGKDIKYFAAHG